MHLSSQMPCGFSSLKRRALPYPLGFEVKDRRQCVHAIAEALTDHDRLDLTRYVPLRTGSQSTRAKRKGVWNQMHKALDGTDEFIKADL